MAKDPLEGIRVLFIGSTWAGPMCSCLFSDMGAEVIRLESHTSIDPYRVLASKDMSNLEAGPLFQVLNRNALSITLNMSQPRARELAKDIVKTCDVLLENNSPGVLKAWGLDYDSVRKINPRIIMVSISGFGQTGPLSSEPAYGPASSSISGLSALLGYEGESPLGMLSAYPDPVAGVSAFFACMAALHYRVRTGKGQYVDQAQLEILSTMMGQEILDYTINGRVASCAGNSSYWMSPHGCYRCKGEDKWITIACTTEEEWGDFCRATGNTEWLGDERFADSYSRVKNHKELDRLIEQWSVNYTDYEAMEILQKAGVAAAPIFAQGEIFTDPHSQQEEYLLHLPHPHEPGGYVYNVPWKLSKTPGRLRRHAPLMGEHNEYVLCELCGLSKEELQKLIEEKVVW